MSDDYSLISNSELLHVNAIIITGIFILLALGSSTDIDVDLFGQMFDLNVAIGYVIVPFSLSSILLLLSGGFGPKKMSDVESDTRADRRRWLHNIALTISTIGFVYVIGIALGIIPQVN